jgi:hypothetical protein
VFIRVHPRLNLIFSPLNAGNFRASSPESKTVTAGGIATLLKLRYPQE